MSDLFQEMKTEEYIRNAYPSVLHQLEKQLPLAIRNAKELGYSFIVLKRNSAGYSDFVVKHALWHEVDSFLRALGAKGVTDERGRPIERKRP